MYAIKGSWVGQTFALSTTNDSAGRKSRIRRSKEERKSMVETFIKRYQCSNNGNFPSLNLTHKEVGGSFYTVREIVREIIQENRVLGPARFSPELLGADNVAIQYPLGSSTASEIQGPIFHPENEQNGVSNHNAKRITELTVDTEEHYISHQDVKTFPCASEDETDEVGKNLNHQACSKSSIKDVVFSVHEDDNSPDLLLNSSSHCFDETETSIGGVTDINQTNGLLDETDKLQAAESLVSESVVADEELALNGAFKAQVRLSTEEVEVETFPVRTENDEADDLSKLSADSENFNGTWNDFEMKSVDSTIVRPNLDTISSSVDSINHVTTKETNGSQLSVSGSADTESSHLQLNGEIVQHDERNPINEASDYRDTSEITEGTSVLHENMDHISLHSAKTSRTAEQPNRQSKNASKGMTYTEGKNSNSNDKEPPSLAVTDKNNQKTDKAVAASSPPVDRINLQSWERAASKRQPNPLLAIVKAFADALIKFWS